MIKHEIAQGECMASLGSQYGFFWKTLWNHPSNAELKSTRKDPNVLLEGDEVVIPDKSIKNETRPSSAKHRFVLKGVPEQLNIRLLDVNQKPRANLDYIIVIDGVSWRGKTNTNGELKESISPAAKDGRLLIQVPASLGSPPPPVEIMTLNLGHLDPLSEISGLKARLANLGLYSGPIDSRADAGLEAAIGDFQRKQKLPVTGKADDPTIAQLQQLHGR